MCQGLFFNKVAETMNTFFTEHLWTTASRTIDPTYMFKEKN